MGNIINTNGNIGNLKASAMPVIIVDTAGNIINFTSGTSAGAFVPTAGGTMSGDLVMNADILPNAAGTQTVGSISTPFLEGNFDNLNVTSGVGPWVLKSGDTMSGDLIINANLQAGNANQTSGNFTQSFGDSNQSNGDTSFSAGSNNIANGYSSVALGGSTVAQGDYSLSLGANTQAIGNQSVAEGNQTVALGENSHAENTSWSIGNESHAENNSTAVGASSHSEGNISESVGYSSHAKNNFTQANSDSSSAEGNFTRTGQEKISVSSFTSFSGSSTVTINGVTNLSSYDFTQTLFYDDNITTPLFGNVSNLQSPVIIPSTTTLTAHYFMDDNAADTIVVDNTGNYDATSAANTDTLTTSGKIINAFTFNGSSDFIDLSSIPQISGSFAVSMWVYPNVITTAPHGLFFKGTDGGTNRSILVYEYNGSINVQLTSDGLSSNIYRLLSTTSLVSSVWQNVVVSWDGTQNGGCKIYINNVDVTSEQQLDMNGTTLFNSTEPLVVGKKSDGGWFFDGNIDDVRIYSGPLSTTDVSNIYNSGNGTQSEDPLVIVLNESTFDVDVDLSGFNLPSLFFVGTSLGIAAHSEGGSTVASNDFAHAEGYSTIASGWSSHAQNESTTAYGDDSHAEGYNTSAGDVAHAEGDSTTASGYASHAQNYQTQAIGNYSTAIGDSTVASGSASFAGGTASIAGGNYGVALGVDIETYGTGGWVFGDSDPIGSTAINNTDDSLMFRFQNGLLLNDTNIVPTISGNCSIGLSSAPLANVYATNGYFHTLGGFSPIIVNDDLIPASSGTQALGSAAFPYEIVYSKNVETSLILTSPSGTRFRVVVDELGLLSTVPA